MKKTASTISLFVVALLQVVFLSTILFEKISNPVVSFSIALVTLLTVLFWRKIPHKDQEHFKEDIWLIPFVIFGAICTYLLSNKLHLETVIAVGIIGFISSYAPNLSKTYLAKQFPAAMYCGSFVGMTGPHIAQDFNFIIAASFVAGIILVISKNIFHGYGGKLGSVAFGGVVLVSFIFYLVY
ncbi:hypothetical protein [Chondrinema litorale]|uniref:hypothetical protein n=1 Tax=Chondrinema litorale TaxID=2994555 RepID=UPI002543CB72|nr:hypothetical protein [Chondrinema litorale]UZR94300.1 hypothetical protein OQ292_00525 [Chondrinema litorale]